MKMICLLAALALASATDGTARAQLPGQAPHIQPELLAESMVPAPGSRIDIAIAMTPEPGWHGYWINPGDAGLPLDAKWTLPSGVTIEPLRYPAPGRLVVAGLMNHVFERSYALLARLQVPAGARTGDALPIALNARWLACTDTICVPEQASLTLNLTVGDGTIFPPDRARFDSWRAALPRPLGSRAHYAVEGDRLRIAIPYPAAAPVGEPWFYPQAKGVLDHAAIQTARRKGDLLIVETKRREGVSGSIRGVAAIAPGVALAVEAQPGPVPPGGEPVDRAVAGAPVTLSAFLLALGGALLGGLLLNVMPCVFPILSLKAIALARAGADEREARIEAIAYTAGILLCCLALGGGILALRAAGQSVGWAFQLQDNRVIAVLLVLAVALTANLAGTFRLPALAGGRGSAGARGAFLTGILAAFVATPCTGPFMAAAMGAALVMPWPLALTIFAGLGIGLALPFLALAFVPSLRRRLPRPGAWMERLRHVMAVPMALTVLGLGWLLWRQGGLSGAIFATVLVLAAFGLAWWLGRGQASGRPVTLPAAAAALSMLVVASVGAAELPAPRAATTTIVGAVPFSEGALARLRAGQRPVFLFFTADWCLTCKVNESAAIADPSVLGAFSKAGVTVMEGDWTRGDPAITRFLEAHGRSGVPLYLYYAPGAASPRALPQLLTPAMLRALPGA